MKKKHIITIVGRPGSGKSTTAKLLAAKLGYKHFSSGDLFRAIGKDRGLDVLNVNLAAEKEKNIDYMVDQKLREIGKKQNNIVIESRMAWHWILDSFKVYLDLELGVAAQRIINDMDTARREHEDVPEDPVKYAAKLKE